MSFAPGNSKNQKAYREKVEKAVNKAFKDSGAGSKYDYALATVIHEFLHAIGTFKPDVSEDIFGNVDGSDSLENQKEVIKKCFTEKK
ncbi:MAG: hypothetical protein IPK58_11945 [Acidobacteria bacterium]|nr:hypothetical protein [Acidobacteriota bacterium]